MVSVKWKWESSVVKLLCNSFRQRILTRAQKWVESALKFLWIFVNRLICFTARRWKIPRLRSYNVLREQCKAGSVVLRNTNGLQLSCVSRLGDWQPQIRKTRRSTEQSNLCKFTRLLRLIHVSLLIPFPKIIFVFVSPYDTDNVEFGQHLIKHGDGVKDVSFAVENLDFIVKTARQRGATIVRDIWEESDEFGTVRLATLQTVGKLSSVRNSWDSKNYFSTATQRTLWSIGNPTPELFSPVSSRITRRTTACLVFFRKSTWTLLTMSLEINPTFKWNRLPSGTFGVYYSIAFGRSTTRKSTRNTRLCVRLSSLITRKL